MTALEFYKYIFMAELLVAEGMFVIRLRKRNHFALRAVVAIAVCFLATLAFPMADFVYTGYGISLMFLILSFVTLGAIIFVCKIPFKSAVFCAIAAYTLQHLSYEIFKLIFVQFDMFLVNDIYSSGLLNFSTIDGALVAVVLIHVDIYIAVYAVVYFFLAKKIDRDGELRLKNTAVLVLAAVILLVDIVLNAVVVYIDEDYNKIYDTVVGVYNCLCCILVFYVQYSIIDIRNIKEELEIVSHLLWQAQRQYDIKKEQIEQINIKCHDMKYQISKLISSGDYYDRDIAEIENLISVYDATIKTGNDVLDIILTEKSLICQNKKIKLTCIADGKALSFMSEGELYSLFGNILDNAVEAVEKLAEESRRDINLNIRSVGGVISVMAENYYDGSLNYTAAGLPVTSKADKNNHGFGLKSIRVIVEKYGGNLSISAQDGVFRLSILIPLQQSVTAG